MQAAAVSRVLNAVSFGHCTYTLWRKSFWQPMISWGNCAPTKYTHKLQSMPSMTQFRHPINSLCTEQITLLWVLAQCGIYVMRSVWKKHSLRPILYTLGCLSDARYEFPVLCMMLSSRFFPWNFEPLIGMLHYGTPRHVLHVAHVLGPENVSGFWSYVGFKIGAVRVTCGDVRWRRPNLFVCQLVKYVIHAVIGSRPNFPYTKYGG